MKRLLIALLVINLVFLVAQQFSGPQQDAESGLPMEHEAGPTDITYQPNPLFQTTENVLESGVLEGGVTENSPEQERIESVESLPPKPTVECLVLGPFRNEREALGALKVVDKFVEDAEIGDRDSRLLPDYVVYVGPEPDIELARVKAAEFTGLGIDNQMIGSGRLKNTVSLGVFSRKQLADELLKRVAQESYEPKIRLIRTGRPGYQLRGVFGDGVYPLLEDQDLPFVACADG